MIAESVSLISNINGKTEVLISVSGSKSKGFFLDTTFWSNVQQSYGERFFVEGGRDTNFSSVASIEHKAMQT